MSAVPVTVRRAARGVRRRLRPAPSTACHAPQVQLYFFPDGDVRPCCMNTEFPLGNVGEQRLLEIWHGARRRRLVERLAADDFSLGCEPCEWEIAVEGRASSLPAHFDAKAGHVTAAASSTAWPRWMEFNLSNTCNLQCVQCFGDLSSSIRIHREKRPPLPKVYGDEFFEDLEHFLPHLRHAQFAGGEPFLASENYRAWDLIVAQAPHVEVQVVTNATQWNKRVEGVLDRLAMSVCFSIDGITKPTYESIRYGADLDQVLANVDRFCEYARRVGTGVRWNFCLMRQNVHEFADVLRYAEARGIEVVPQVVHSPAHSSLAALPPEELAAIHRDLLAQSEALLGDLRLNAGAWRTEVARIGAWAAEADPVTHDRVHGAAPPPSDPTAPSPPPEPPGIMGFAALGSGPRDTGDAERALASFASEGTAHRIEIDAAGVIVACPHEAAAVLGRSAEDLVGQGIEVLEAAAEARFGPCRSKELLRDGPDERETRSVFGDHEFRSVLVVVRDRTGRAERVAVVFALRPVT